MVIFPGGLARFLTRQAEEFLQALKSEGTTAGHLDRMNTFQRQNEILGLAELDALRG